MFDEKTRGPRPSRDVEGIPPARRVDRAEETPARRGDPRKEAYRRENRPRYGGYAPREERPPREERLPREESAPRPERPRMPRQERIELPENMLAGRNPIREALRGGLPVEKLLAADGDLSGAAREILALAREKGEAPFLVALDGITDPHNLGAIIRSAECAGAHGVIIPQRRSCGLTPTVVKAAAGSTAYLMVARVPNLNRTLEELREKGVWTAAAALEGEDAFTADLSGPLCLVIGSEGDGISRLTLEKCDRRLTLPMKGHIDSLNASVAAGILLFQAMRARLP